MIVHDKVSHQQALELIKSGNKIFYSDELMYSSEVSSVEELDGLIQRAFVRNDVIIVSDNKQTMEYITTARAGVFAARRHARIQLVKEYIRTHPKEVARLKEKLEESFVK